jgi:hypothetical protein
MHIEYRISDAEYRNAAGLAMRRRSSLSSLDYFVPYIFAIIWLVASLIPTAANDYLSDPTDLLFTLGAIPILAGFLYRRKKAFTQDYKRLTHLHPLQILNTDTKGIQIGVTKPTVFQAWQVFTKFAENPQVFILYYQGNHNFLPIVKGHLTSLQVDELRSMLLSRLPQA